MRIVDVSIRNFRGISNLSWQPPPGVLCLVGPGDSGKTTILEAIESALYPRWALQFVDSDFFQGSTAEPIEIEVTVVDVPSRLLTQDKYGLDQRGFAPSGEIHDEPEDEDTPALTVRLRIDESLEPAWHVISDRNPEGRVIPARDREILAAVPLGDDVDRQLAWTRGSSLTRLNDDPDIVSAALSAAHRKARDAVSDLDFDGLKEAAEKAGEWGVRYGAQLAVPLDVGIDARQLNVGSGSLTLAQADRIPARSVGLGSRRLLALAIQRQAAGQSVVMLVDEVEHGLEPHRLRHLLQELRRSGQQVLLTSHSDTAIAELGTDGIAVVRRDDVGRVGVLRPDPALQGVMRAMPEALLARRVIVCEGATEYGISRGLVSSWDATRDVPLAARGAVFVPGGGGDNAAQRALALQTLGFECAYWADSDRATTPSIDVLRAAGVQCIVWDEGLNTEQRIGNDVSDEILGRLWELAVSEKGAETVANQLGSALAVPGSPPRSWPEWLASTSVDQLRSVFGSAAARFGWFKTISAGEQLGTVLAGSLPSIATTDLARKADEVQAFAYGD